MLIPVITYAAGVRAWWIRIHRPMMNQLTDTVTCIQTWTNYVRLHSRGRVQRHINSQVRGQLRNHTRTRLRSPIPSPLRINIRGNLRGHVRACSMCHNVAGHAYAHPYVVNYARGYGRTHLRALMPKQSNTCANKTYTPVSTW